MEGNKSREHPGADRPRSKGKGRGPSSRESPWGQGPYPQELPLPRSLPSGGNSVPRRCPPQNEAPGAFPFYCWREVFRACSH